MFNLFSSISGKFAKATPKPTTPYESAMMKQILAVLVEKGFATTLEGEPCSDGSYFFSYKDPIAHVHYHPSDPFSPAVLIYGANYLKVRKVVGELLGNNLGSVVAFCEDHATNKNSLECRSHMMVVQIAIAHATSLNHSGNPLRLKGNFSYVARLEGSLIVDGNVGVIQGNFSSSLTVNGNVEKLGVEGLLENGPVSDGGRDVRLVITGNLGGYKTHINNPNMTIEIGGNVTTKGAFLYKTNIFKRMVIQGDVLTEDSICPGFYAGDLQINGKADHLNYYLNVRLPENQGGYRNSSAFDNAREARHYREAGKPYAQPGGNIFIRSTQVLRNGIPC